jgi:uncharacterized coiled-coil DUF342 family protein
MRIATPSQNAGTPHEQLYCLSRLLEEALAESNELHHRIREIQLRIAELSASVEAGRLVAAVRATG